MSDAAQAASGGSLAPLLAIQAGTQLFNAMPFSPMNRAIRKEQEQARRTRRRRRAFADAQGLTSLLGQIRQGAEELPRAARRSFQARTSSFAQDEARRISDALATAGVTGASDTAARQRRALGGDIIRRQLEGDVSLGQFEQGLRQQAMGSIGNVMNLLYPGASQLQQQEFGSAGQFTDPLSSLGNLAALLAMNSGGAGPEAPPLIATPRASTRYNPTMGGL